MNSTSAWRRCVFTVLLLVFPAIVDGIGLDQQAGAQSILYVDDDAPSGGDGSSWDLAFDDLQAALTVASDPKNGVTEIRVGQGEYVPSQRTDDGDPRSVTFALINGVTLAGGFAGYGAKDGDARDFEKYVATLSGDINGDDGPDFVNYGENAYHVVTGVGLTVSVIFDGFAVSHGNGSGDGGGGGMTLDSSSPLIQNCTFASNKASAVRMENKSVPQIRGCLFDSNTANDGAGLVYHSHSEPKVLDCAFINNRALVGTSIRMGGSDVSDVATIEECVFQNNIADTGNAGIDVAVNTQATIRNCRFLSNSGFQLGGGIVASDPTMSDPLILIEGCEFTNNWSGWAGAAVVSQCHAFIVNSTFCSNSNEGYGGTVVCTASGLATIVNSTFADNSLYAVLCEGNAPIAIRNSIFWGNSPSPFHGNDSNFNVLFSNVQGGWIGPANINSDPLFIQAGCCKLQLGVGSPCIDAGNNGFIPSGITTDLDGKPRIINGTVDMGAFEGEYEMLPPAVCEGDLDEGEFELMVIGGGPNKPDEKPALAVSNDAGGNDAYINVTQVDEDVHSGAGGFNELGHVLNVDTSLPNGAYFMRVSVPFDESNLNGFDPFDLDLTSFDSASGNWGLAVEFNVQNSPDHKGPVGDRILVEGEAWQGSWTFDVGDYGVFWNPSEQRGFVWANVDHATEFAFGTSLPNCIGDVTYPGDSVVNTSDLTALLDAWGTTPSGPASFADLDHNGIVDVDDLLALINGWGDCP